MLRYICIAHDGVLSVAYCACVRQVTSNNFASAHFELHFGGVCEHPLPPGPYARTVQTTTLYMGIRVLYRIVGWPCACRYILVIVHSGLGMGVCRGRQDA